MVTFFPRVFRPNYCHPIPTSPPRHGIPKIHYETPGAIAIRRIGGEEGGGGTYGLGRKTEFFFFFYIWRS